jgi:hypothetical protein
MQPALELLGGAGVGGVQGLRGLHGGFPPRTGAVCGARP